jgi:glycosyltransferase involved in cell wall biosynthesis
MGRQAKILVVIPARNEEDRIRHVIHSIHENLPACDILVIEDSSTDNTVEVARSLNARVVSLPINMGYGGAIRTGFQYALSKGYGCVITMDSDGQHDGTDLPAIVRGLSSGGDDLVIGSRFLGKATYSIPFTRRLGMSLFSMITSAVVGKRITDTTSGFMGVGSRALPVVAKYCATDFPNAELICTVAIKGLRVGEVPIRIHEREGGESMFTLGKAIYYPFKLLLAISMVMLRR